MLSQIDLLLGALYALELKKGAIDIIDNNLNKKRRSYNRPFFEIKAIALL